MKLWLLMPIKPDDPKGPWHPWYDKAFGFVVRAQDEGSARRLANEERGDETRDAEAWFDSRLSHCIELTADDPREAIVLRDFRSA